MKKRERGTTTTSEEADAKQRKIQAEKAEECESSTEMTLKPFMSELEEIQKQLQDLDEQCAQKQLEIQKAFDQKKKPVLEKRQLVLDKVPGFWGLALRNHPDLVLTSPEDAAVLKFLKEIDLDDNLDDAGSYRIKFVFSEEAKTLFSPLELVKEVRFFHEDPEGAEVVSVTEIKWKNPKDNPVANAISARAEADDEDGIWSIFEWFTKDPWPVTRGDVGEAIRRDIWHSPVTFYLGEGTSEDELEDGEDGEDGEDDEDDPDAEAGSDAENANDEDDGDEE